MFTTSTRLGPPTWSSCCRVTGTPTWPRAHPTRPAATWCATRLRWAWPRATRSQDADLLTSSMFVGDVIGGHGLTPLLAAAEDAGCSTANGDQMVEAV
jgi:hypothetical protein